MATPDLLPDQSIVETQWPPLFQTGLSQWVEQVIGDVSVPALQTFNLANPGSIKWKAIPPPALVKGFYHPADRAETGALNPTYAAVQTANQSGFNYQIHASDKGHSFEGPNGDLILLFGDVFYTGGAYSLSPLQGPFDVMAFSQSQAPPLLLAQPTGGFFETTPNQQQQFQKANPSGNYTLLLQPGPSLLSEMGGKSAPYSGITLNGSIFVCFRLTGSTSRSSVLSRVDVSKDASQNDPNTIFTQISQIDSSLTGGHFIQTSLYFYTVQPGDPPGLASGDYVLIFGSGELGNSDVCLSAIPAQQFTAPNPTIYYLNKAAKGVQWSNQNGQNNLKPLTSNAHVFDFSVAQVDLLSDAFYPGPARVWVMIYDNNKGEFYVQFSATPWGGWTKPQRVLTVADCLAGGAATGAAANGQPFVLDKNLIETSDIIAPDTTGGNIEKRKKVKAIVPYGPMIVERFCHVVTTTGQTSVGFRTIYTLKLFYTISAGCPYYCTLMETDFLVASIPAITPTPPPTPPPPPGPPRSRI